MKGYEMILLVNGLIFLIVGLLALGTGITIERHGRQCETGNASQCERNIVVGSSTTQVAPYLSAIGVALVGLALTLVAHRRWYGPAAPTHDEGPEYP